MTLLPFVSPIYFWKSTVLKAGDRAIFIFLQDLFQESVLMSLRMSNIPIQNKDGLYYIVYVFNSFFLERCGKGMKVWLYSIQAFKLNS